jgi:hypothetical protein
MPLGRRMLTQAVKRSPVNLRPLLRIDPSLNAKALALVASAYVRLAAAEPTDGHAQAHARRWLDWLATHRGGNGSTFGWGYPFKVETRFFGYARDTPNAIATSFVIQALLDGHELLGNERYGEIAAAGCDFLTTELLVEDGARAYFRYLPAETELVHNANLLGCAALMRAGALIGRADLREVAQTALQPSLEAQRTDGSWPYAEGANHGWVDNFHTGYVLDSLAVCARSIANLRGPLERGLAYWERELFLPDGTPKYTPSSVYPLDAHCYATAIDTWLAMQDIRSAALDNAERIAALLLDRMLDPAGYVHFQRTRLWKNKVPFVRWTTAPTFRALAGLQLARVRRENAAHAGLD